MIRAALLAAAAILAWVVLRRWAQTPEPARFSYVDPHWAYHPNVEGWKTHQATPNTPAWTYTTGTH